jgi:hypothetical protein
LPVVDKIINSFQIRTGSNVKTENKGINTDTDNKFHTTTPNRYTDNREQGFTPYANEQIKIDYPSTWGKIEKQNSALILFSPIKGPYLIGTGYTTYIDVPSVYNSPTDFVAKAVWWDGHFNETWFKTVEEISSKGRTRILEPASDITNSIEKQKSYTGYVHLPIDLRRVNSPSQYLLIFVTEARYINTDGFLCALIQKTDQVANPPPKITIFTEVDSLTIDPIFRTKTIEAKMNSSSDIPFNITLLNSSTRYMEASFNPPIVTLPPSGWVTSQLTVNSKSDRTWNDSVTETLPIAANISGLQKGNYFLFGTQTRNSTPAAISEIESLGVGVTLFNMYEYLLQLSASLSSPVAVLIPLAGLIGGAIAWLLRRRQAPPE